MPYHEVLISSPIEKIHDALTTLHGLSSWWTQTEFLQNGNIRFHFGPDYFKEMKIVKTESDFLQWHCVAATEEWIDTTISFELRSGTEPEILSSHPEVAGQMTQNKNPTLLIF